MCASLRHFGASSAQCQCVSCAVDVLTSPRQQCPQTAAVLPVRSRASKHCLHACNSAYNAEGVHFRMLLMQVGSMFKDAWIVTFMSTAELAMMKSYALASTGQDGKQVANRFVAYMVPKEIPDEPAHPSNR